MPQYEPQEVNPSIDHEGHSLRNKLALIGIGHLVVAAGFVAEAVVDFIPEVPSGISGVTGLALTMGGVAKLGYALKVHSATHSNNGVSSEQGAN